MSQMRPFRCALSHREREKKIPSGMTHSNMTLFEPNHILISKTGLYNLMWFEGIYIYIYICPNREEGMFSYHLLHWELFLTYRKCWFVPRWLNTLTLHESYFVCVSVCACICVRGRKIEMSWFVNNWFHKSTNTLPLKFVAWRRHARTGGLQRCDKDETDRSTWKAMIFKCGPRIIPKVIF